MPNLSAFLVPSLLALAAINLMTVLAFTHDKARAASGGWRVQLGAFSEDGRARALWGQLTGKVSGLSAYQPYLVKAGAVTRLQAGPVASSNDASRLCSRIKAAGADCIPKKM